MWVTIFGEKEVIIVEEVCVTIDGRVDLDFYNWIVRTSLKLSEETLSTERSVTSKRST